MKWFQIKERSAGKKRLLLCWYIYKFLGKKIVKAIAYCVALVTFILNKDLRSYTSKYFEILYDYTNDSKYKPTFQNGLKNVLSYAFALVDKMEVFTNRYDAKKITFAVKEDKESLFGDLSKGKGVFFICNHIGNVEVLRALFNDPEIVSKPSISIFLQKKQCEIFNNFISSISEDFTQIKIYPIEDIDLSTAFEIKDNLDAGEIVFMAGDRMPVNNTQKMLTTKILDQNVSIPQGAFKFAKILDAPVYFITCLEQNNKYKVFIQKTTDSKNITKTQEEFAKFTTEMICIEPFQFYNFYDFFENYKK